MPGFTDELIRAAGRGVQVRVCLGDPDTDSVATRGKKEGIEERLEPGSAGRRLNPDCTRAVPAPPKFARTLNLTDITTGRMFTRTVRNNAHARILAALKAGVQQVPFEVTGLDFDNGKRIPQQVRDQVNRGHGDLLHPVAAVAAVQEDDETHENCPRARGRARGPNARLS